MGHVEEGGPLARYIILAMHVILCGFDIVMYCHFLFYSRHEWIIHLDTDVGGGSRISEVSGQTNQTAELKN